MPTLKDIIADRIGVSHLSQSPLWHQDVSTITPGQMVAFVAKMKFANRGDEAESALETAMQGVQQAVARGEIPIPSMLSYRRPDYLVMTQGELRRGLAFMKPVQAYAVMFALETGLAPHETARLTHQRLAEYRRDHQLSDLAEACLERIPRHVISPYVFWRTITSDADARIRTAPVPIMDLDEAVFDAFGLVWAELVEGYANLIRLDEDADRASIECFLYR